MFFLLFHGFVFIIIGVPMIFEKMISQMRRPWIFFGSYYTLLVIVLLSLGRIHYDELKLVWNAERKTSCSILGTFFFGLNTSEFLELVASATVHLPLTKT